jgi:hypothetical protein
MNIIFCLIGATISYLLFYNLAGKSEGDEGKIKSLVFETKNFRFWFHHWFIFSVVLSNLIILKITHSTVLFFTSTILFSVFNILVFYFSGVIRSWIHWLILLIIVLLELLVIPISSQSYFYFIAGLLVGGIIQGLTYSDWWTVIVKK